jgi:glycerophosphoryl diester phosphodiesterase
MTAVFAHRGCTEGFVENTLEAFAEAKRLGADGVELDVRLTADGALAVLHDPAIEGLGPVADLTVAELPAHVPLLADALGVCDGLVVNVEIKNDPREPGHDAGEAVAALTAEAIAEAGWTDRVIVSSFQVSTLQAVRAVDGRLAVGVLWPPVADLEAGLALAVNEGWQTVNNPLDLSTFVGLGVDAVITDRLADALAIAVLGDEAG